MRCIFEILAAKVANIYVITKYIAIKMQLCPVLSCLIAFLCNDAIVQYVSVVDVNSGR